ncbi:hypothetical protein [Streptomyces vietnamensis]|uniref:hypothetical protein n=1 Tax=Streptomyces vietnamensis TaxID=362257 RepID=UPI0034325CF7
MGIRLFVEVLDFGPAELTWRERHALSVLAENANDATRECWPGIEEDPTIAHRMRLPARSSRYEVLAALRSKKALETVSAGRRGSRAVYKIPVLAPAQGPETSDPNEPTGSGEPGPNDGDSVREPRTQTEEKGPESTDPNSEKGSGNDLDRVRERPVKGPGNPDPFPSVPSTPQEEDSSSRADDRLEAFGAFWLTYPKKINRGKAQEQWIAAMRKGADPERIIAAAQAYARTVAGKDPQYTSYPANWLRLERYDDEYPETPTGQPNLHVVGSQRHKPFEPPADTSVYANGF